jgi:MFS family permease
VQVHQTKYLVDTGFSPHEAAWALGAVSLAGVPGQIALGQLSDRIGREPVWAIGSLGFRADLRRAARAAGLPQPRALLWTMVLAQGLLGYGVTSVFGAIPAEIFEGRHYGSIFGTLMLASIGGGAAGPFVAGAIHDATGSYAIAFWIAIAATFVSIAAIYAAAPRKVRVVAGRLKAA